MVILQINRECELLMSKQIVCSILIPVYNGEKFIGETIESCLAQSIIGDIEIIVIDDCSKDTSFEIIKRFETISPNITATKNEKNIGINKTINKATLMAKGKYILFLGHDDMLKPIHVETILNCFGEDTSFVHCNADLIYKDNNILGVGVNDRVQIIKTKYIKYYLATNNIVHSTGAIIQKKFLDDAGGWDEQFKNYGEWLLWIKLASLGKVKYSTKIRALYRRHDTNITNSFEDDNIKIELFNYFKFCQETALLQIENIFIRNILHLYISSRDYFKNTWYILLLKRISGIHKI